MLTISRANSIHFVRVDTNLPSIVNRLSCDEKYGSFGTRGYTQKWNLNRVTFQMASDSATVPTVEVIGETGTLIAAQVSHYPATSSFDERYYYECDVDFALFTKIQVRVTQGADVWLSEIQESHDLTDELENGEILQIDYTNHNNTVSVQDVQIDWTTGIQFVIYVEAVLKDIAYTGEDKVFTNVTGKELIEAQTFKTRRLATMPLPEYMTDKIVLAGKSFYFAVNGLFYVVESMPDIGSPQSNLRPLLWQLIHTDIIGLTNDGQGIDITQTGGTEVETIKNFILEGVTGSQAINVNTYAADFAINNIVFTLKSGIGGTEEKVGLTAGASDVMYETDFSELTINIPEIIICPKNFESGTTVYFTLTGTYDINLTLMRYKV